MVVAWLACAALARQDGFEADVRGSSTRYDVRWTDGAGTAHAATFALPTARVTADRDAPRRPPIDELTEAQARAVRAWAASQLKGVELTVKVAGSTLSYQVSGQSRDRVEVVLAKAQKVADQAGDQWLVANEAMRMEDRSVAFDHARLAVEYADDVAPIAAALAGPADARGWANLALGFVQDIPYEARANGGDKGYRRPLALVDRDRGDCDSKSALFLALMRSAHPEVHTAVVYVPNHALVALDLPPEKGDATVKIDGERWVLAEPVGPAALPVGIAGRGHQKQAKKGEIHPLEASR